MAGLQEKTTYRLALFPSVRSKAIDMLQKKTIKEATSKVIREITD